MREDDLTKLEELRALARERSPAEVIRKPTLADRAADIVAATVGSWRFIGVQSGLILCWIAWNSVSGRPADPYPFILLNLLLSFQAAYTAPIIMMSQNRQSDIDRERSIQDFNVNQKAELEIELLHAKVDLLREQEIARLAASIERLSALLAGKERPAGEAPQPR